MKIAERKRGIELISNRLVGSLFFTFLCSALAYFTTEISIAPSQLLVVALWSFPIGFGLWPSIVTNWKESSKLRFEPKRLAWSILMALVFAALAMLMDWIGFRRGQDVSSLIVWVLFGAFTGYFVPSGTQEERSDGMLKQVPSRFLLRRRS